MTIPDVNVLLYAADRASSHHSVAQKWLVAALAGSEELGIHPLINAAFVRVSTNPRAMTHPIELAKCLAFIDAIQSSPNVRQVSESAAFWGIFKDLLTKYNVVGPSVADMYIAALAIDQNATLCSADQGFARIKELKWHNLLGS